MNKLLIITLLIGVSIFCGCESSDDSPTLTPVLNEQGIQETNDSGELLYTDSSGNVGTEVQLNAVTNLNPVKNAQGEVQTNDAGDVLYTDGNGNSMTESEWLELYSESSGGTMKITYPSGYTTTYLPNGLMTSNYDGGTPTTSGGGSGDFTGETGGGTAGGGEEIGGNTGDTPDGNPDDILDL